ncbi:MAG: PepSY-associated TM helix domain-containing protein [Bacteroidota bacterium]
MLKFVQYIKSLRSFRKIHRYTGVAIALLVIVSALTGILLALKKDISVIQPPTRSGINKNLEQWKPLHELASLATEALHQAQPTEVGNEVDRMDARPSKGIVKVLFEDRHWEVQIDASTGEVYSIARRHSDWIEALHDGSIVSDLFKLVSMNVLGWGLLGLTMTGLWLWYGPKVVRKIKREKGLSESQERSKSVKEKAE